jgi:serine/threonine-protein kinase
MTVSYTVKGDSFSRLEPRLWPESRLSDLGQIQSYDLAPDGKRMAALLADSDAGGQNSQTHLTFLLNFFDELRRRAPVTK